MTSESTGADLLKSTFYTPAFDELPKEINFDNYCSKRKGINWLFMAEITNDDYLQESGFMRHNQVLVCDRTGKDNILVLFYHTDGDFNFTLLKKGHTIFLLQAMKYHFRDGNIGFRIEDLSTVFVVPCSMKDVLALSALYHDRKDAKCWSCSKKQSDSNEEIGASTAAGSGTSTPSADSSKSACVKLKKCTACNVAHYCSKKCQATDWKERHRRWCKVIPHFIKLTTL